MQVSKFAIRVAVVVSQVSFVNSGRPGWVSNLHAVSTCNISHAMKWYVGLEFWTFFNSQGSTYTSFALYARIYGR